MKTILILLCGVMILTACDQTVTFNDNNRHYAVVDVTVSDVEKYDKFIALEKPILKQFDAFIVMDIRSPDQKRRYLVISFPDRDTVGQFVKSSDFQKILPLNKASAKSSIFHGKLFQ